MLLLDVRTIGIIAAVTSFILSLVTLIHFWERKVYQGFGRWVLANFGFFVGFLLIALRGSSSDLFSIILGNAITVYSEILIYEGVQVFYNSPPYSWLNYLILSLYILLQSYFTIFYPDINARIILVSVVFFMLILRTGAELFQYPTPDLKRISRFAGTIFVATALFPLTRIFYTLERPGPIDLFHDVLNSWYSIALIGSIIAWTFSFFFMNSARLELELQTARQKLELMVNTDFLTGLYNRSFLLERAEVELQRVRRYGSDLSILLIEIDDFKQIVDRFGRALGDCVLTQLAGVLKAGVRYFDIVARYGEDEFCVMLINMDQLQALALAKRLQSAVENSPVVLGSDEVSVKVTIGLTCFEPGDTDISQIIKRADNALYEVKRQVSKSQN